MAAEEEGRATAGEERLRKLEKKWEEKLGEGEGGRMLVACWWRCQGGAGWGAGGVRVLWRKPFNETLHNLKINKTLCVT